MYQGTFQIEEVETNPEPYTFMDVCHFQLVGCLPQKDIFQLPFHHEQTTSY